MPVPSVFLFSPVAKQTCRRCRLLYRVAGDRHLPPSGPSRSVTRRHRRGRGPYPRQHLPGTPKRPSTRRPIGARGSSAGAAALVRRDVRAAVDAKQPLSVLPNKARRAARPPLLRRRSPDHWIFPPESGGRGRPALRRITSPGRRRGPAPTRLACGCLPDYRWYLGCPVPGPTTWSRAGGDPLAAMSYARARHRPTVPYHRGPCAPILCRGCSTQPARGRSVRARADGGPLFRHCRRS